ncbi:MAG: hypothetical protein ACOX7K_08290 [Oscillospiraceae bacterium]|jgi:hypothetical protein
MKRNILFPVYLMLLIVGILFLFTALVNQTDPKNADEADDYYIYNDLPIIKASSAAYLLAPAFTVTAENFFDCAYDYFKAPTMLYFSSEFYSSEPTWAIKNPKKAVAFADVFRNVSLTQLSEENAPAINNCSRSYCFINVIGNFLLSEQDGITYISFLGARFCAQEDLVSEIEALGESLKDDSFEIPLFEPPE